MNHESTVFDETPWEERNLGVKSFSLHEQGLDSLTPERLLTETAKLEQHYEKLFIFARVPKSYLHLVPPLQQCGFYLIEGTVCPYIQFRKNRALESFTQDEAAFIPKRFKGEAIDFITPLQHKRPEIALREIARGSFSDDRFHMDFQCPASIADSRFEGWMNDLLQSHEIDFDLLNIHGEVAGFMARKKNHLILAGFSKKYQRSGLGEYLWLNSCRAVEQLGYQYAETLISTNNLPVLNLYSRLGFKFRDSKYSFHKWKL